MNEAAIQIVASQDAAKAQAQPDQAAAARRAIAKMKRSLASWLKYRERNDAVAAGKVKADVPAFLAAQTLERDRDYAGEQKLAEDLYALLAKLYDPSKLPTPNVAQDRQAAVKLAKIALAGKLDQVTDGPQATGFVPVLIITLGAVLLFTATSFISNRAEVQKEQERIKCIRDGACTDYGFWLKAAGVTMLGYFVWEKLGVGARVKGYIAKR